MPISGKPEIRAQLVSFNFLKSLICGFALIDDDTS